MTDSLPQGEACAGRPTDPSVVQHRVRVLSQASLVKRVDRIPAAEALGRVLADDVAATLSVPPFDHAAMDGFAVRSADLAVGGSLPVAGAVAAGESAAPLAPGAAVRIMLAAPLPAEADVVIPFEWTTGSSPVRFDRVADAGRHIRREGEDVRAGEVALLAGTRLGPAQMGLLASIGAAVDGEIEVRPRPRLGVISTGAELVGGQVPDSNTPTLVAAGRIAGADAIGFGPAPDDSAQFREILARAAENVDVIVTTGGISAGDHDVVKAALRDDESFWFGAVAMKPGRPQGCGVVAATDGRNVPVVCLPGTPIAAYVSFQLYAVPLLRAVVGSPWRPVTAPLAAAVPGGDRTVVLPAVFVGDRVLPLKGHAGHSQRLLAAADALVVVPPGEDLIAGAVVEVLALQPQEEI